MTVLIDLQLPRTVDIWVQELAAKAAGENVQAWLFEGATARRAAELHLAAVGIQARFRSAYKPLVHHFEEEVNCAGLDRVTVRYPVHPAASPRRFALEAYPLADMLAGAALQLEPQAPSEAALHYDVELHWTNGASRSDTVFAPNRVHQDLLGHTMLSPCAWFMDRARPSEYEELFRIAMETLHGHPWPPTEPYFERLDIRVDLPGSERAPDAPWIDLHEALHEDLYFSLLEMFQRHSGRPPGDRRLQPGQIVPDIRVGAGESVALRIGLNPYPKPAADETAESADQRAGATPLARTDAPLHPARILREMSAISGERFAATSRQHRIVAGVHHRGDTDHPAKAPALMISGGQHANETSGVVGALRAAQALVAQTPSPGFALIALENPDGYALHRELRAQAPSHMHHAARYTALGDDIEYRDRPPFHEREARQQALEMSGAMLHINLHGYPAHEWTRPLSGYIPRGFEPWTVPKGFFLILRHRPGWAPQARQLAEHVCRRLAGRPDLMALNAAQRANYNTHAGELPFEVIHGTACSISEVDRPGPALTLITEFPDETIYGDPFILAHDTQTATVVAAAEAMSVIFSPTQ